MSMALHGGTSGQVQTSLNSRTKRFLHRLWRLGGRLGGGGGGGGRGGVGRGFRRLRYYLAGTLLSLAVLPALVGSANGLRDNSATLFRPGGLDVEIAGYVLDQEAQAVAGCLRAGAVDYSTIQRAELTRLLDILSRSSTGRSVLRQAQLRSVSICADDKTDLLAYYFADMHVVGVNSTLSEGGKIMFLAHELTHVPQHPSYSDNRYFSPGDLILLRRVREAAAEATATRIVWELRQNGYAAAWREKMTTSYGDVAEAFEAAIMQDSSGGNAQHATRAAFDQWFKARWRLDVYDQMTMNHLERISTDHLGLIPLRYSLSHRFLQGIAWLNGRNFLTETQGRALTDPYYAGKISLEHAGRISRILQQAASAPPIAPPVVPTTDGAPGWASPLAGVMS